MDSVLIVDDEPAVRDIMARWGAALGLESNTAANAEEALETLKTRRFELAFIDVMMPGHDGLWLAGELQRAHPQTAVVIATAYANVIDQDAPRRHADFLIKPFQRDRFALAVDRGLQWRKRALDELGWHRRLSAEVHERTEAFCRELEHPAPENDAARVTALVQGRMPDVMAHGERVSRHACAVGRELGLENALVRPLDLAARFHDIGKVAMPDALLTKPSPLSDGETDIMRKHVDAGARMLTATRTLGTLAPIVVATHEWFGGNGYPSRLAGDAIPLASRIISVVDSYDAMTTGRSYRGGIGSQEAVTELLRCQNTQFDPRVVAAFLAVLARS